MDRPAHLADPVPGGTLSRRRARWHGLAAVLTVLLAAIGGLHLARPAAATEVDAIRTVTISDPTDEVRVDSVLTIDATWAVPDSTSPGDTFTLVLPSNGAVQAYVGSFDLRNTDGALVGTCVATAGTVTCTLSDFVATHDNVHGTLSFTAKAVAATTTDLLLFTTGSGTSIEVTVPGGPIGERQTGTPPTEPFKYSFGGAVSGQIYWGAWIPGEYIAPADGQADAVITDTWDGGMVWEDSFVLRWILTEDFDDTSSATVLTTDQYDLVVDQDAHTFTLTVHGWDPPAGVQASDVLFNLRYLLSVPAGTTSSTTFTNVLTGTRTFTTSATYDFEPSGDGQGDGDAQRQVSVTKAVEGAATDSDQQYLVELTCTTAAGSAATGYPQRATVTAGQTATFSGVPVGAT